MEGETLFEWYLEEESEWVCMCVCERERETEREEGLHRQFEYYFSFVFRLWLVAAFHLNKINFEFDESEKEF